MRRGTALPVNPDIVVCLEMGWSWQELMETPPNVVEDVKVLLRKRALIAREQERAAKARTRR